MDFGNVIFSVIAFYIAANLFFILVLVIIIRAIFRINPQINLLKSIDKNLEDIKSELQKNKRVAKCQCCGSTVTFAELKRVDSGQYMCKKCREAMISV